MRATLRSILLAAAACAVLVVGSAFAATFRDIGGNTFTTGVTLGTSGTLIEDSYAATLTTNFVGVAANACKNSAAITLTGAAAGDTCIVGVPSSETTALNWSCFVSGTSEAKIKICNPTAAVVSAGTNPSTGVYTVRTLD